MLSFEWSEQGMPSSNAPLQRESPYRYTQGEYVMPASSFRFQFSQPARLATLRATLRLLYTSHPRAFVTSSIASLFEPLFYPALLLLLHHLLQHVIGSANTVRFTPAVAFIGLGLVLLVLVQRMGIILRDSSSTILRQQAWVVISKRIMQKLPAVPYPLFENHAFQSRHGLAVPHPSHLPTPP